MSAGNSSFSSPPPPCRQRRRLATPWGSLSLLYISSCSSSSNNNKTPAKFVVSFVNRWRRAFFNEPNTTRVEPSLDMSFRKFRRIRMSPLLISSGLVQPEPEDAEFGEETHAVALQFPAPSPLGVLVPRSQRSNFSQVFRLYFACLRRKTRLLAGFCLEACPVARFSPNLSCPPHASPTPPSRPVACLLLVVQRVKNGPTGRSGIHGKKIL